MSMWAEQGLLDKVTEILADVDWDHHFGRPFVTAYQLAIELQHRYPDVVEAIDRPVGGVETGQRNSLAQYLANQLSRAIKAALRDLGGVGGLVSWWWVEFAISHHG